MMNDPINNMIDELKKYKYHEIGGMMSDEQTNFLITDDGALITFSYNSAPDYEMIEDIFGVEIANEVCGDDEDE